MPNGYPTVPRTVPLEVRFWSKADVLGDNDCWPWLAHRNQEGYGSFWLNGRMMAAHRVAYAIWHGLSVSPPGRFAGRQVICHTCDNPSCVNPRHLFSGTDKDNAQDRNRKGRGWTGGAHTTKLNPSTAEAIRARYKEEPLSQRQLAREYGVSQSQIGNVLRHRQWK